MNAAKTLIEELQSLLDEQTKLTELSKNSHFPFEFNATYQPWYSRAIKLLELFLPIRLPEFISYYEAPKTRGKITKDNYVIQDFTTLKEVEKCYSTQQPRWDASQVIQLRLANQIHILSSLNHSTLHGAVQKVTDNIYSSVLSKELHASERLLLEGEIRAAGVIAGVALEGYLINELANRNIKLNNKNSGINAMSILLKDNNVFNNAVSEHIKALAYTRNICAHNKADIKPQKEEVQMLIAGVNEIIKHGFKNL